ncbi:heat shock protein transcriptional repressor HspR [Scardovia wiggsiae]|uniref:heat shock protein transcriptional repressor HspR n=1 Tax=Scardovia wiggsiae TaxID=230143 RepID=UPI00374EF9F8
MGNRLTARDREAYTAYAFGLISGAFDIIGAEDEGFDVNKPVFTVGQTAELVGIHPQTLRQYDRLALIVPQRTAGGARRYSLRDINKLVLTQHLVIEESINLSGVSRILRLMEENRQLRRQIRYLKKAKDLRMFAAGANGNVTEVFGDDSPVGQMKRELARRRRALRMARARGRLLPPGQYSRIQLRITAHTEGPDEG